MNKAGQVRVGGTRPSSVDGDELLTLGVLQAVAESERVTQRSVARELGIALGLANAYLKLCIKKGYIKVSQVPANRYFYYVTPKGFREKGRLTVRYLTHAFDFFRSARNQCGGLLADAARQKWNRVLLCGDGELAEIATICAADHEILLVGLCDERVSLPRRLGLPVLARNEALKLIDAILLTDLKAPQATYDELAAVWPAERILVPSLLGVAAGGRRARK